jgi:hypothetical protein
LTGRTSGLCHRESVGHRIMRWLVIRTLSLTHGVLQVDYDARKLYLMFGLLIFGR